jgi:4-amino-4-deoxy-L-arabinose transferase-like glycosyltransferase
MAERRLHPTRTRWQTSACASPFDHVEESIGVRIRWERLAGRDAGAWLLFGLFLVCGVPLLGGLDYNYDEGVYIQQALLILQGKLPFRDFFYHQTPLFPFSLAAVGAIAPRSILAYRAPSLLATALAGVFVYRIALHFVPRRWALIAMILFYAVPLQFYGLLAMPIAMMQFLVIAGIALAFFSWRPLTVACGIALCCFSVLYKPLSVAACLALGISLVVVPEQRRKIPWAAATVVLVVAAAWGFFHLMSDGAFTQMVFLQASRIAASTGFEKMMEFEPFRKIAEANGVSTPFGWNLNEQLMTFFGLPLVNGNLWLLLLGIGGLAVLWGPRGQRWRGRRLLLTLWLGISVWFTQYLWEPIWDHYCIQYVPPLAVLATVFLHAWWTRAAADRRTHAVVVTVIVLTAALGVLGVVSRHRVSPDLLVARPVHPGEAWLTFDPFVNFVTGTVPACGVIDPLNTYGPRSLVALAHTPELSRYYIGPEDVVRCLENDPAARVSFGAWAVWFVDPQLRAYVDQLPANRIVQRLPPS